jgi:hypothetical protein
MSAKGDQAHKWAAEIYDLSTKCLMAHSIRAVERYIEEFLGSSEFRLAHRIKVTESNPMFYMGKRAIAYISVGRTEIKVDAELGFEAKRLAIAHELGHILFAKSRDGDNLIVRNQDTESSCGIFEKQLCKRHHLFYSDPDNITHIKFPSLFAKGE